MLLRGLLLSGMVLGSLQAAPTLAGDLNLRSSSKWLLNYDRDSCTLARAFGEGDDEIIAQFVRFSPRASFRFVVIGKPLATWNDQVEIDLRFGTVGEFTKAGVRVARLGPKPKVGTVMLVMNARLDNRDVRTLALDDEKLSDAEFITLHSADLAVAETVSSVTLRSTGSSITLDLGPMRAAMAALEQCSTNLVMSWGFDPKVLGSLSAWPRPRNSPMTWVTPEDYPMANLLRNNQAQVDFRLMIDAEGNPTDCLVQSSIGDTQFSNTTCTALKKRARFFAARDKNGANVASYYVGSVNWVIPK